MSKDEIFDSLKLSIEKWEKENLIELLLTICTELIDNGVAFGSYRIYSEDGFLKCEDTRYGNLSIREKFTLNFKQHDEEVKEKLMKELLENIQMPNKAEVSTHD